MHDLATDVEELFAEASQLGRPYRSALYRFGEGYSSVTSSGLRTKDEGDPDLLVEELIETQRRARSFRQEEIDRQTTIAAGDACDEVVRDLVGHVARRHGISGEELLGRSRTLHVVDARRDLYVVLRARGWSLPRIARLVRRDHTTILSALRRGPSPRRSRSESRGTSRAVIEEVAARHGLRVDDILGRSHEPHVVEARRDVCAALREQGWSFPAIGWAIGRNHASVMALLQRPARPPAGDHPSVADLVVNVAALHNVQPETVFEYGGGAAAAARADLYVALDSQGWSLSSIAKFARRDRTCIRAVLRKRAA